MGGGGGRALAGAGAEARRAERIVLCVTHDLEALAGICDHVVVLRRGRIAHDEARAEPFSYEELKERYHKFTE